jgi:hypothetical protein
MRSAYLHRGVFWQVRHQMLVRLMIAAILPKRWNAVRFWLAAPYVIHARQRAMAEKTTLLILPYYLVHDVVEFAAVARGAYRFRTLVL